MTCQPRIAFLGIGLMGAPQARNVLKAEFPLVAWNRSRAKAEALVADGASVASTPAEAALTADLFRGLLDHAGDLDHAGLLVELEHRNPKESRPDIAGS